MILFSLLIAAAAAMTAAQDVFPGRDVFHTGWYNVIDAALLVWAGLLLRARRIKRPYSGAWIAFCGAAIVVFCGISAGLMGADTHTVVGAPGATVPDDQIGASFVFPLAQPRDDWRSVVIRLQRGGSFTEIGPAMRYTGGLALWQVPRTAVWVTAMDPAGNGLTITQPTNTSFLSPVLSMQQTTTIAGMAVRYDSFAVPALRKTVKAVYFSAEQAARLGRQAMPSGTPAILFAVADRDGQPVKGGIAVIASGTRRRIDGLQLSAAAGSYPAVTVASVPYLPAAIFGGVLLFGGALKTAFRW